MGGAWETIKSLFSSGLREESKPRTFAMIKPERAPGSSGRALPEGQCYVKVTLARMQLRDSRFLNREYYPVVHSFVELSRQGADRVTVPFIAGPAQLSDLGKGEEQVILAKNVDLIGPTPYIGGNLNIAIGLCAAVAKDYLDNLLGVLGSISGVVGGTALTGVLSVIEPLKDGAESLLGMSAQVKLKVGVVNGFSPTTARDTGGSANANEYQLLDGYYALINVDENNGIGDWLYFEDGRLLAEYDTGERLPVHEDHLVFRISQYESMPDWSRIPGLNKIRTAVIDAAINEGLNSKAYQEQFAAFKRNVVANADLVKADRVRIVQGLEDEASEFARGEAPVELHAEADPGQTLAATAARGPSVRDAWSISLSSL